MTFVEFIKQAPDLLVSQEPIMLAGDACKVRAKGNVNPERTQGWASVRYNNGTVILIGIDDKGGYIKKGTMELKFSKNSLDVNSDVDNYIFDIVH